MWLITTEDIQRWLFQCGCYRYQDSCPHSSYTWDITTYLCLIEFKYSSEKWKDYCYTFGLRSSRQPETELEMKWFFQTKAQTILIFHQGEMIHISIWHLFLINLILAIVLASSHKWSSNEIIPSPLLLQNNENLLSRLWSSAWTQWEVVVKLCNKL